jgi:hypothetical protein
MKTKLPRKLWKCIDPYILDVIKDLNRLPFIKKTVWSCAECGPIPKYFYNSMSKKLSKHIWLKSHTEGLTPYVSIVYNFKNKHWKHFHLLMMKIAKKTCHSFNDLIVNNLNECVYYLNSTCPPSEWDKVRNLIKRFNRKFIQIDLSEYNDL